MASKCLKTLMLKEKLTIFTMGSWVKSDLNTLQKVELFHQEKSSTNKSNKKRSKKIDIKRQWLSLTRTSSLKIGQSDKILSGDVFKQSL